MTRYLDIFDVDPKAVRASLSTNGSDKYTSFIERKRKWEPAHGDTSNIDAYFEPTLKKAVALAMSLELPVGELTYDGSSGNFKDTEKYALIHNATDEDTHYRAFKPYEDWASEYLAEADNITQALLDEDQNPVFIAGYMELGIFFVSLPILRYFGNAALSTLSGEISRDESSHVLTNWALIDDYNLGSEYGKLASIRREVVDWLTCDLDDIGLDNPKATKDFWVNQSDSLIKKRQADLKETQAGQYVSFFEIPNTALGAY
jgi:hypothetical protein